MFRETSKWYILFQTLFGNLFLYFSFMIETIAVILIILWLLGVVTSYTVGGFIHILLVIAIIMLLVRVINRGK